MVNGSQQQLQHSEPSSSLSNGSGTTSSGHHQLAAEVPKKRTGRRVFRETRHPVYRGVRSRKGDKWVCEVREPNTGTRVWLGTYPSADMAARAHDVAALAFRGKSACLNFADSAWRLPVPASTAAEDVRRAAAEAAELFRPTAAAEDEQEYSSSSGPGGDSNISDHQYDDVYRYVEEMELVEMPRLMAEMAEGLLLSPPRACYINGSVAEESERWRYVEEESCSSNNGGYGDYDWSLWNH